MSGLRAKKFRVKERKRGGTRGGGLQDKNENGERECETERGGDGLRSEG